MNGFELLANNASNSRLFFLRAGGSLLNIRLRLKKGRREVFYIALCKNSTKIKKLPSLHHDLL